MKKLCPECQRILGPGFSKCTCGYWQGDLSAGLAEPRVPVALKAPYVSIDIETTGLDPDNCQILEFGAIYDNGSMPINELPVFRRVLQYNTLTGSPFALALNAKLLNSMSAIRHDPENRFDLAICVWANRYGFDNTDYEFDLNILDTQSIKGRWYGVPNKLLVSNLNVSQRMLKAIANPPYETCFCHPSELIPLFAAWLKRIGYDPSHVLAAGKNFASFDLQFIKKLPNIELVNFKHRCIDPAMLYWQPVTDEVPPGMAECLKRAGLNNRVAHSAVDDAKAVVHLVRRAIACPNIGS